jgi:hypothetical protein
VAVSLGTLNITYAPLLDGARATARLWFAETLDDPTPARTGIASHFTDDPSPR